MDVTHCTHRDYAIAMHDLRSLKCDIQTYARQQMTTDLRTKHMKNYEMFFNHPCDTPCYLNTKGKKFVIYHGGIFIGDIFHLIIGHTCR
jgi:hypothetical protein